MSAHQHWITQREQLRAALRNAGDTASATHVVRHAIAQVEQNTMAEQADDLLRQQTGILFSCVKGSLNLLDIAMITQVWQAQSQGGRPKERKRWLWLLVPSLLVQLAVAAYGYYTLRQPLLWVGMAISLGATVASLWIARRKTHASIEPTDALKVTAKPDEEKLYAAIESQMKAIDRYIHDFSYLNEQNTLNQGGELHHAAMFSDLLQSIGECEGEAAPEAQAIAEQLLLTTGARAVAYSPEVARLFTVLPSLGETRTITPALVSQQDGALLARGAAAVRQAPPMPAQEGTV